jgi:hypothetical protein
MTVDSQVDFAVERLSELIEETQAILEALEGGRGYLQKNCAEAEWDLADYSNRCEPRSRGSSA